jgi:hypothetical protein
MAQGHISLSITHVHKPCKGRGIGKEKEKKENPSLPSAGTASAHARGAPLSP